MELKPGYKQTEVGVIPEGWEVLPFREVFNISAGGDLNPKLSSSEHDEVHRYPIYSNAITERGLYGYCSYADHLACSITITARGTLGVANYRDHKYTAIGRVLVLEQKTQAAGEYFAEFINNRVKFAIESTGVPQLTAPQIGGYRLAVPPYPEQRAIAGALSDVDELIGALDQFIAKKGDLKHAVMQQLLTGQTRLPGFHGEWSPQELRQVIRDFIVPMRDKPKAFRGHIPWCRIEDFDGKYLAESQSGQYVDEKTVGEMNLKVYPVGTLLVSCSADLGRCAIVVRPLVSNQTFIGLVMDQSVSSSEFLYYYMTFNAARLNNLSSGTTISYLSREQFESFGILIPPTVGEQTAIAAVLSDMDAEIATLEARLTKTHALKQGMMQELLTGRIRLPISTSSKKMSQQIGPGQSRNTHHNWAFSEAVVIAALTNKFGLREYPLGRLRYTKLAYLMHRHVEGNPEGYLKKAAGPYNPATRYKGPEGIAQKNGYVQAVRSGTLSGFVSGENIDQALVYFRKWYGSEALEWLDQFRYEKNEALELLATVDMAILDLRAAGMETAVENVKGVLRADPEWKPKLRREVFSDANIKRAIAKCQVLFG